jgi:hypothetical protein
MTMLSATGGGLLDPSSLGDQDEKRHSLRIRLVWVLVVAVKVGAYAPDCFSCCSARWRCISCSGRGLEQVA